MVWSPPSMKRHGSFFGRGLSLCAVHSRAPAQTKDKRFSLIILKHIKWSPVLSPTAQNWCKLVASQLLSACRITHCLLPHTHTHKDPAMVDCRYWCCNFVSVGPAGPAVWVVKGKLGILRWKKLLLIYKPFIFLLWRQVLQNLETFSELAQASCHELDCMELLRNFKQKG